MDTPHHILWDLRRCMTTKKPWPQGISITYSRRSETKPLALRCYRDAISCLLMRRSIDEWEAGQVWPGARLSSLWQMPCPAEPGPGIRAAPSGGPGPALRTQRRSRRRCSWRRHRQSVPHHRQQGEGLPARGDIALAPRRVDVEAVARRDGIDGGRRREGACALTCGGRSENAGSASIWITRRIRPAIRVSPFPQVHLLSISEKTQVRLLCLCRWCWGLGF